MDENNLADEGALATREAAVAADAVALPWYASKTVLGIIAAMILTAAQKYGLLTGVTQDQLVSTAMVIVPLAFALYGRLTTTKPVVTLTGTKARALNGQQ